MSPWVGKGWQRPETFPRPTGESGAGTARDGRAHDELGSAHPRGCWQRRAGRGRRLPHRGGSPRIGLPSRSCAAAAGRRRAMGAVSAPSPLPRIIAPSTPAQRVCGSADRTALPPASATQGVGSRALWTEDASAAWSISTPRAREAPKRSPLRRRSTTGLVRMARALAGRASAGRRPGSEGA